MDQTEMVGLDTIIELGKTIDLCRVELMKSEFKAGKTFEYLIARMYGKVIVTSCEIRILLGDGYPEGAMALTRQLYEGLVIIDYILDRYENNDFLVIDKFLDASYISVIKEEILRLEYAVKNGNKNKIITEQIEELNKEILNCTKKYGIGSKSCLNDYWWANSNNFDDLVKKTSFDKNYMYRQFSDMLHFNAFSVMHFLDDSDSAIPLGNSEGGYSKPLFYSSFLLCMIVGIINEKFPQICNEVVKEQCNKMFELARDYSQKKKMELKSKFHNTIK